MQQTNKYIILGNIYHLIIINNKNGLKAISIVLDLMSKSVKIDGELGQQRRTLLLYDLTEFQKGNYQQGLDLEKQYLRYLILIQNTQIEFETEWNDTFQPVFIPMIQQSKYAKLKDKKFELVCTLFNLTIIYIYLVHQLPDNKQATTKARNALWTIDQILLHLDDIDVDQADLNKSYLKFLSSYCYGFVYLQSFKFLESQIKQQGAEEIVTYLREGGAKFLSSLDQLKIFQKQNKNKIPPIVYNKIIEEIEFQITYAEYESAYLLSQELKPKIQDNPKINIIGKVIGYLQYSQQIIIDYMKNKNFKPQVQDKLKEIQNELTLVEVRNNEIYKCQIIKAYFKYLEVEKYISQKQPQFEESFIELVKQNDLKQKLTQLQKIADDIFYQNQQNKNKLQMELEEQNILQPNEQRIPQNIKQKLQFIQERGGINSLKQGINELKKRSQQIGVIIINLKNKIKNILLKDQVNFGKQGYQNILNNQDFQLFQLTQEFLFKRLQSAQIINMETYDLLKKNERYLILAEVEDDIYQEFTKLNPQFKLFAIRNQKLIQQLNNQYLDFQKQQDYIQNLYNEIQVQLQQSQLENVENLIKKLSQIISELNYDSILNNIQSLKQKEQEIEIRDNSIYDGLKSVSDCFLNVEYGLEFYNQIQQSVNDLAIKFDEQFSAYL
ncbi:hypothetical protein pb186bvf_016870 [Paramecium bursaria]